MCSAHYCGVKRTSNAHMRLFKLEHGANWFQSVVNITETLTERVMYLMMGPTTVRRNYCFVFSGNCCNYRTISRIQIHLRLVM